MNTIQVIKFGGAELKNEAALMESVEAVIDIQITHPLVIVHGAGPEIADYQKRLGFEPKFVEGLRVTDDEAMKLAEMVLSGLVNKRFIARLNNKGIKSVGISGVDGGLLKAKIKRVNEQDLGRVGEIYEVNPKIIYQLIDSHYLPVVSPISLGDDGCSLNVNADEAALAIAQAVNAEELTFISDVPGILASSLLVPNLTLSEAEKLIEEGLITGGMIPKTRSAISAVQHGVKSVRITNLEGLKHNSGTILHN